MLSLAITFYDIVLTVHILAVVVAFGVVFSYPVLDAQFRRGGPGDLAALHRLHVVLARRVITPAMTVVLIAGLYLALDRWSLGDPWIGATLAILFVLFGLTSAVLVPADLRLAELAERRRREQRGVRARVAQGGHVRRPGAPARRRGDLPHGGQARRVRKLTRATGGRSPCAAGEPRGMD